MNISLHSDIIRLRSVEPSDASTIYEWENNLENWLISSTLIPFSRYDIERFVMGDKDIYLNRQLRLMIEDANTNYVVGAIDLYDFDPHNQRAGIGILIASEADRKQGLASAALKKIIYYSFDVLLLKQLYCTITANNNASIGLFESLGFTLCARKQYWVRTKNGWLDELMYQYINSEI